MVQLQGKAHPSFKRFCLSNVDENLQCPILQCSIFQYCNVKYCNVQYCNVQFPIFNGKYFQTCTPPQYSSQSPERTIKENASKRSHKRFIVTSFIYKLLLIIICIFICHLLVRADISDCSELHLLCVGRIHCTSPSAIRRTGVVRQGQAGDLNL